MAWRDDRIRATRPLCRSLCGSARRRARPGVARRPGWVTMRSPRATLTNSAHVSRPMPRSPRVSTQADDLVQAAFEAAARDWGILRCLADEQRRGWLRTTVANIAVSGFRREAAWRDRLPRIEARYRKTQADTEALAFSLIALKRCWQIIKDMPERQHAVAVLRWQQDMKETEIAAALGISEKTVSVHLYRARRQLIGQLGPNYPFASGNGE